MSGISSAYGECAMPHDLIIYPNISEHDLKVLSRLRAEFDHKIENGETVPQKQFIALGKRLYEALINSLDGGTDQFLGLRKHAIAEQTYVRINIISAQAEIQALPWELAFHADKRLGFLSRNPEFTLLRRWQKPDDELPELPGLPLKILLFIASPEDLDPEKSRLDFETEENFLFEQLDDAISKGKVEVDVAEDGSLETLQEKLETSVYHVVHLSMHGQMRDNGAVLAFESHNTAMKRLVSPEETISVFKKAKYPVPCIMLAACQTAQPDTLHALPDFVRALIEAGMPHVIGMRRSVGDVAATYFAGLFYRALAEEKDIDRAVREARLVLPPDEPSLQWSIPVLYSRKQNLQIADGNKPFEPQPRRSLHQIQIGNLFIDKQRFVGRRAAIRQYYRNWANAKNRHLLIYGIGGVGKTTLAGYFAVRLKQENPSLRIFAFAAPIALTTMEEQLRETFLETAGQEALAKWQMLEKPLDSLTLMIATIAAKLPCLFIFDNLETCLTDDCKYFLPEYNEAEELIIAILHFPDKIWSLITCRYPVKSEKLANLTLAELPDTTLGDILRFMRTYSWPDDIKAEEKAQIFKTLGGNFRSIEWFSGLISDRENTWRKLKDRYTDLPLPNETIETAAQATLEAMRQSLVFDDLLDLLTPAEKLLLKRTCLESWPLPIDGLNALWDEQDAVNTAIDHLVGYRLVESAISPYHSLLAYKVPPLVVKLLAREPLSEELLRDTHARLGKYWRFAGKHFTQFISDYQLAFEHFTKAELQEEADALLKTMSSSFHHYQQHRRVVALLGPYVRRCDRSVPFWALNSLGVSLHHLGEIEAALQYYWVAEKQLKQAQTKEEKEYLGTTLNNIANIYHTRGDYHKSFELWQKSLAIQHEIGDRKGESQMLSNISQIYKVRGDHTTALEYLQKSLAICGEIGDREGEAMCLNNIGLIYDAFTDYDKALEYYEKSLAMCREIGNQLHECRILNNIGQVYKARSDYDPALEYLQNSLTICYEIGLRESEVMILNNLGQIYKIRGDLTKAELCLKSSLKTSRDIGSRRYEAAILDNLGEVHEAQGNYDEAMEYFQESLAISEKTEDRQGAVTALNNIGQIYYAKSDYQTAIGYFQKSLAMSQEVHDRYGEERAWDSIALVAYSQGDHATALDYWQKSLVSRQRSHDRKGEATILNNIGGIHLKRGEYVKASECLQKSLVITEEIGDREGEARTLNSIGMMYEAQGDYAATLEHLQNSLRIRRELRDRAGEATTLNNIGLIYRAKGDFDGAMECWQESLAICRELGDRDSESTTLNNIASIHFARGDYATALDYFEENLTVSKEIGSRDNEGQALNNISQIYQRQGDYTTALEYLQKSMVISHELGDRAGEAAILINMATALLQQKDYLKAQEYLQMSLAISQEIGNPVSKGAALHSLAVIHWKSGLQKAVDNFVQALQIAQEINNAELYFDASRDLGHLLCMVGQKDDGFPILQQALEVGRAMGHSGVPEVEELLRQYS